VFTNDMKLALLADRADPKLKEKLVGADALVTLGDLHPAEVPIVDLPHLFVHGNHDSPNEPFPQALDRHDLHLRVVRIGSVSFGGFQGSMKYKPKGHYLYDDGEVAALLDGFPAVDVFVAHAPCTTLGINDGVHDGFRAFDEYIQRARPKLFLCGHVHRKQEVMMGRTRCVSVYGAGEVVL
jgi:Icc-related predicted phosphoesterase